MKKVFNICLIVFLVGLLPLSARADVPAGVDVPSACTALDTSGASHVFPQDDSPSDYLGICMLQTAKEAGLIDFTLTNDPSFGLYIQSVNGIAPGATEYWAIWSNGALATCGIGCIPLSQGDTLSFVLTDWTTNVASSTVSLRTNSLLSPPPPASKSEGGGGIPRSNLNVTDALAYLASKQREDGSFGSPLLSDWVAVAFAAADPGDAKVKLAEYMRAATPTLSSVTDYERHAMALLALGINPYSGTQTDYLTPIVTAFDGTQIGDASLDNDDIFALFPLLRAGYSTNDNIIQKITAFILSAQQTNGSWDNSVDMTASAIQALVQVRMLPGVSLALIRAEGYLRHEKPAGNSFSISWVRQALSALSWTPSGWTPNSFTRDDFLTELQQSDGGIEPSSLDEQTRVWATAYAIPAALGKSWPMLLQSFVKPATSTSTSTAVATSTPSIATSTTSMSVPTQRTTTAISSTKPEVRVALLPTASPATPQIAGVAGTQTNNLFGRFWNFVTSFFINLL